MSIQGATVLDLKCERWPNGIVYYKIDRNSNDERFSCKFWLKEKLTVNN